MRLDPDACYRALQTRDPRFDGRFFTGVQSTGIYCRPVCPARTPKRVNCVFLPCAAAAQEAGFRPCLRCRPESAPGTPAWAGTSTTVSRGLRLIDGGALDSGDVAQLAARLGVGERHLRRLFVTHVGASPQAIALTRRVSFAKQLIDETQLAMADVAFSAGFSSIRRFNAAILESYGRPPRELRRSRLAAAAQTASTDPGTTSARASSGQSLTLRLPYRPPLDWTSLLRTLEREAATSVARVDAGAYIRTFRLDEGGNPTLGRVRVRLAERGNHLVAELELSQPGGLILIADRLRRIFDLHADPFEIETVLGKDPRLSRALRARPGVRIPGSWDAFEFAATTLVLGPRPGPTGRRRLAALVERWGAPLDLARQTTSDGRDDWPSRLFPTPEALTGARLGALGLPNDRTHALGALASAVADARRKAARGNEAAAANGSSALCGLAGLDEPTAQRIALRGLGDPDAFPAADPLLRRALAAAGEGALSARAVARRAESWKPWRGYAAMLLWDSAR